jgi:site-specific DNA recombinase
VYPDTTSRGLAGQALKKFWAGGKPYSYRLVQLKDETHLDTYGNAMVIGTQLVVDDVQAAIVREIFTLYASDYSQRAIAAALNERSVPSPGSSWRGRIVRRASGWLGSTINALVGNELYRGRLHWNKSEWRKDPDSGKRKTRARPRSEWISHEMEELRIIDEALWQRVIERQHRASVRGANVRAGIAAGVGHTGRGGPKYAFSGLLRCGICGSSMVIVGGTKAWRAYGCSGNKHGGIGVCANGISVRQEIVELRLLAPIRTDLLTPEKLADLGRRVAQKQAAAPKAADHAPRNELRGQIENLTDAVASGALRASPALAARLTAAEAELERLTGQIAKPSARVIDFPGRRTPRCCRRKYPQPSSWEAQPRLCMQDIFFFRR